MNFIQRTIEQPLRERLNSNKVIVLLGPRRTGKTILLRKILEAYADQSLFLNGEDFTVQEILQRRSIGNYKQLLGDKRLLLIDEAQKIPEIGNILKLMIDEFVDLTILVTGSSAFDMVNYTGEPLTGRKKTYYLFPLSEMEFRQFENPIEQAENLRHRLIYGNYPELLQIKDNAEKTEYLRELVNDYLIKDILAFENIRNSDKLISLLRLIAFQVGEEVSHNELSKKLSLGKNTVERYLDLLAKVFVLFKIGGFSRNLRKEVTKSSKYYFYDNGLRNALIANMNPLELRDDVGKLWENYAISERLKFLQYTGMVSNNYFWRTYDQQEIDWIEDRNGKLHAYEMKWKPGKTPGIPSAWKKAYPGAVFEVISPDKLLQWTSSPSTENLS